MTYLYKNCLCSGNPWNQTKKSSTLVRSESHKESLIFEKLSKILIITVFKGFKMLLISKHYFEVSKRELDSN